MFLLLFFLRSSICRSPCSPSFSFFRCFVFSSSRSVCFLYRPRRFSFFFSLPWRIRLLCYFVLAVFPPALLTSLKYGYSPCVLSSFLRSWRWFFFFFPSFLFFDFDLDIIWFILSFSCGYYAVSSVSVTAATRLACDMYLDTYAHWSHFFIFVWGVRLVSVIVYYLLFLFAFLSKVIFHSRFIGACPVTTDCIVAMSYVRTTTTVRGTSWYQDGTRL